MELKMMQITMAALGNLIDANSHDIVYTINDKSCYENEKQKKKKVKYAVTLYVCRALRETQSTTRAV